MVDSLKINLATKAFPEKYAYCRSVIETRWKPEYQPFAEDKLSLLGKREHAESVADGVGVHSAHLEDVLEVEKLTEFERHLYEQMQA